MGDESAARKTIVMAEIAGKGGICHYTFNLCRDLQRYADVVLLTGKKYELHVRRPAFRVVEIFNRFRTHPLFLARFMGELAHSGAQVVHFQLSQHPALVLVLCAAARLAGRRVVVTAHNIISHEERAWERVVYRAIYRMSRRIIVHAGSNREELEMMFPSALGKTSVIPHGNYMFFSEDPDGPQPPPAGFNLLFFGYIRRYKGLLYLIRALKRVRDEIPQVKLSIVGKPVEDFGPYRAEIRRLGLERNIVTDLAYVPFEKVREYFQEANVVVLPYLKVYQSGVLQLAYGFSRPVVATDAGGMAEAVDDGRSGFVVPPGNEIVLADRLAVLLKDAPLQWAMGRYAWDLARTKFSWERIAAETVGLYEEVCHGRQ